jgi:hypothetical protein
VEQLARERVQDDVHAPAVRLAHDIWEERRAARVEDVAPRDVEGAYQVVDLVVGADGSKDAGAHHAADVDGGDANATAGRVDQDCLALLDASQV